MKKIILLVAVLAAALAVPSAASFAAGSGSAGPAAHTAAKSGPVVRDCAWAQRHTRFMAVRVKKVRKRVVNGQLPVYKLKQALRIYKSALRYKNSVCAPAPTTGGGGGGSTGPTPLALSSSEVANRVASQAWAYCLPDAACESSGTYSMSDCDTCPPTRGRVTAGTTRAMATARPASSARS